MPPDVNHARQHLVAALEADLIGPYEKPGGLDVSDELLKLPPSRWYLTGFLAPMEAREVAEPTDDELACTSRVPATSVTPPDREAAANIWTI